MKDSSHSINSSLLDKVYEIAQIISIEGNMFNQHILEQFEGWNNVDVNTFADTNSILPEHLLFYKAVAQTLGWLQQIPEENDETDSGSTMSPINIIYLKVLLESKAGKVKNAGQRLAELLDQTLQQSELKRPRRLLAVIAGLETWAKFELPDVGSAGALDLEYIQRLALKAGGRARWTALAPLKMYSINKGASQPISRNLLPAMGSAVSRGIEQLFGFRFSESENDYKLSRDLHLKLADMASSSIWNINSGFYVLGGGA